MSQEVKKLRNRGIGKGAKPYYGEKRVVGDWKGGGAPFLWYGRVDQRVRQDFISRLLKAGKLRFLPYPL